MSHSLHWHAGARSRLLLFNLLVMSVTLAVSLVAIFGFRHAGHIQEQAQAQTLADMNGSLALARDTANVAIAAVRLSQVVGALEYQSESARLQQTQRELQQSLSLLASAPLAAQQPQLLARIRERSQTLEQTINQLLRAGHQRHLQRNVMLSGLWQSQLLLNRIDLLTRTDSPSAALRQQTHSLFSVAIQSSAPQAAVQQLPSVLRQWQALRLNGALNTQVQRLIATSTDLQPVAQQLEQSDIAIAYATYRIKALVAMLNDDITHYVQLVAQQSDARSAVTHEELDSIIGFIGLFMLLALLITGYAGYYIYRNLGSSLTAIAHAMTRLAQGEKSVNVPGLARRDELGDLARAFNVFARNTASLAHTSRLLKEKSNQLESTFLAMRDGFALFDNSGQLVVWNAQYAELLGIAPRELHRGLHYQQLLKRVDVELNGLADAQEVRLADGRTLELRFSPVPRRGMVNTVLERTTRKALEEALLHSQKMKAVGQLTGGLAHDFNNLLAVIIGSLALTVDQLPPGTLASRIERARQAADRAAQLTQRLLAFSRKQALYPRAVSVVELVDNLHSLLQHALLPGQQLVIDAQRPGWPAWIDAGQLENALINLVVNARDAMAQQSGEIRLRIWNQRKQEADGKRDRVTIEVIDHGCGMSAEVREQVFEPFFTTKAIGSGSGLGLSMVYGFVRQSGGQIELETAPGQGTTVRLLLPRAPEAAQPLSVPPPLVPQASNDRLVLVLDDEPTVRQTLCEHLHQLGYLTLECGDGESALRLLRQTPDIDLLISDLMLPGGINGADVIRQAQAQWPHLATVLISGQDLRQTQVTLPLCERLAKPWHQAQLVQALERAWQRSERLSRARQAATTAPLSP
ncbi:MULTISPECIES: ATP-binding protein [Pantoea]|uniref:histidine kinase n=1 Tax=Pantoea endophytica TaxID=92488 RepID=A0ABX4SQ28_9GAMM|nr:MULTISPECIES: ATP-binding protein [Pantoea]MBY4951571.1 response regulator [Pantoea sp. DY-17]MDR6349888.1 signal transduction histidine kinase/ActR/RegA family two-component response regulator/HAMP domain-containing protein [Pantoea sp. SORGH_AS_0659]PLR23382.1 hybrid sensor histidine kinase/response regulator [Pantoea endophytica]